MGSEQQPQKGHKKSRRRDDLMDAAPVATEVLAVNRGAKGRRSLECAIDESGNEINLRLAGTTEKLELPR